MPYIHELLEERPEPYFPVIGKDGYGGEQDGRNVVFVGILECESRKQAKEQFPDPIPDWLQVHWCRFHQIEGMGSQWDLSLAYWPTSERDESEIPASVMKAIRRH